MTALHFDLEQQSANARMGNSDFQVSRLDPKKVEITSSVGRESQDFRRVQTA